MVRPGCEIKHIGIACLTAIPECQRPQAWNLNREAVLFGQLSEKISRRDIECVDCAIAKIADQQSPAEFAETVRMGKPPGRVQCSMRCEVLHQEAAGVKDINKAI